MPCEAKVVDYSLDGLGVILLGGIRVERGDVLTLDIPSPRIEAKGEVMWSGSHGSGLRLGIRTIGPMKGAIRDFRFADTFIGLQRSRKTGLLKAGAGDAVKTVYFDKGDMIFSASNRDEDRLGRMLVRQGKITEADYESVVAEAKSADQRIGKALVSRGRITPQELWKAVRQQVEEIILRLFELQDGWFEFSETPLPTKEVITLNLSTGNLIYCGIKRINDIKRILGELPSMESVPCLSPDPLDLFQDIKLDDAGEKIFSRIDNRSPIKEVVSDEGLDKLEAYRTIYALLSVRLLVTRDKESAIETPDVTKEDILRTKADPKIRDMVEDMFQKYESLGYYGVLGIKNFATYPEIKRAYFEAAKRFHPDKHFYIDDDSVKDKLSRIFSYTYEAYTTLSDPGKREEYDGMIEVRRMTSTSLQGKPRVKLEEGKFLLRTGKYRPAEMLFAEVLDLNSTIAEHHYYYGAALAKQGKFKSAANAMGRALNLDPFNEQYMAELGMVYIELGLATRAGSMFSGVLKLSPDNALALKGMARIKK